MKKLNTNIVLALIVIGIAVLAYTSYLTGYKSADNNMDSLLMTMTLDSNFVTAGLYEELPNKVRKTMHFYIEDTPTVVNDVKLFAQVKYVTIGGEVISVDDGKIWNIIRKEKIFQRQFNDKNEVKSNDQVPDSPFADNIIKKKYDK